jgi:uncharacterized membrane protein YbhN (UPF0104 family)
MKIPTIIIITFLVAFLTSFLLDLAIVQKEPARYWLIVAFIVVEIISGFILVLSAAKSFKDDKD